MSKNINNEIEDLEEELDNDEEVEIEENNAKSTSNKKTSKYKYSTDFEKAIKEYLDSFAKASLEFYLKYTNPDKTINECCEYIIGEVQSSGRNAFTDDEVFYLARHYYEEENIKIKKISGSCNVVANHYYELTEEEKKKAREDAINKFKEEQYKKIILSEKKKKEKEQLRIQKKLEEEKLQASLSGQMSLFMEDF